MDLDRLRYYTRWHAFANARQYRNPADPWTPIRIDPADVVYHNQILRLDWGIGRVEGGDWDIEGRELFRETAVYRSLRRRHENGDKWEETPLYRRATDRFDAGKRVRGYESIDAYRKIRCAYLDDLIQSIDRDGYRSNAEDGHEPASTENAFEEAYVHRLEPLIAIGRNGEIQLCEGFHRVAIASILELDTIPVNVLCRHEEWQRTRDRLEGRSRIPNREKRQNSSEHPDL